MERPLSEAQQQQARALAGAITRAAEEDILRLAQTLVAAGEAAAFGDTEFQVRETILRVAAKAYEQHLALKKTATPAPA